MNIAEVVHWIIGLLNIAIDYWLQSNLVLAFALAVLIHSMIYIIGGSIGLLLTESILPSIGIGKALDQHPPKQHQIRREIANGLVACIILGAMTVSYRWLCIGIWPSSWLQAMTQIGSFVIFNNIYSYVTHRLLHMKTLAKFHRIHHQSIRVTPYSSYSVHPIEALIIAATLPLFMLMMPLGVGTTLVLHTVGMVYTTCIHCNYDLMPKLADNHWFKMMINHPTYHRYHHTLGNVNYGFTNRIMDVLFKTNKG